MSVCESVNPGPMSMKLTGRVYKGPSWNTENFVVNMNYKNNLKLVIYTVSKFHFFTIVP